MGRSRDPGSRVRAPHGSSGPDRKSTRLNSSHTVIYTLSLHDALPISTSGISWSSMAVEPLIHGTFERPGVTRASTAWVVGSRSEEHTSELQSHRDLHSFPTRRSSDLHVRDLLVLDGRRAADPWDVRETRGHACEHRMGRRV